MYVYIYIYIYIYIYLYRKNGNTVKNILVSNLLARLFNYDL